MSISIEQIIHKKNIYAIIVRKNNQFKKKGVNFITRKQELFQLGFISHKKKHEIKKHYHVKKDRKISYFSEVLIMKKGLLKVMFFDEKNQNIRKSTILKKDDIILLLKGGHGFEVLKDVEIIEVKQGPYQKNTDKILI
jgi:cupin fold WbuC family metalloprotein|tara:strand:- start:121 stop:534 length:414 start_codon:yes stop_codon:yes gene_type:complete